MEKTIGACDYDYESNLGSKGDIPVPELIDLIRSVTEEITENNSSNLPYP